MRIRKSILTPLWLLKYLPNLVACHVTILHEAHGPCNTVTSAEVASHMAAGEALRVIHRGAADVMMTVAFEFIDTGRDFTFIIRRGVGEVNARRAEDPDLKLTCTEPDFKAFLTGAMNPVAALAAGKIRVSGGIDSLLAFRSYLIRP